MDRFPEAFERFESDVYIDNFDSYAELLYAFQLWAGQNWKGTAKQWSAFNREAEMRGFDVPSFIREEVRGALHSGVYGYEGQQKAVSYRHEVVVVRGVSQDRYRDLKTGRFIKKPLEW